MELLDPLRTGSLLVHLHKTGNKVSQWKLRWVISQVDYLGHRLTADGGQIQTSPKTVIQDAPKPQTRKQTMSFFQGCANTAGHGFCVMQSQPHPSKTNKWQRLIALSGRPQLTPLWLTYRQPLMTSAVLIPPNGDKPFVHMVHCKNGYMTSVLMRHHGNKLTPLCYYSKRLDSVGRSG